MMKKILKRLMPAVMMIAVCVAALSIATGYYNFISRRIYADSTAHLGEVYGQVNRSFGAFVETNWGLLKSWGEYIDLSGGADSDGIPDYIRQKQEHWGFSGFFFVSSAGQARDLEGETVPMSFEGCYRGQARHVRRDSAHGPGDHRIRHARGPWRLLRLCLRRHSLKLHKRGHGKLP